MKLHQVAGVVKVNGNTVSNLQIHFTPANGRPSSGVTDAKGAFDMRLDKNRTGVIPGIHKVWIQYRPQSPAEEMRIREGKSPVSPELQAALRKFGSLEVTPYSVTIDNNIKNLTVNLD